MNSFSNNDRPILGLTFIMRYLHLTLFLLFLYSIQRPLREIDIFMILK